MMKTQCFRRAGKPWPAIESPAAALNASDSVDGDIGQLLFKIVIHQVFVSGFRIIFAAGPAAKENVCSGFFDIKIPAAGRAFFYNTHMMVYPL